MTQPPVPVSAAPTEPEGPRLLNRQTALPRQELGRRLHPGEIPWLIVTCVLGGLGYIGSFIFLVMLAIDVAGGGGGGFGLRPGTQEYALVQQASGIVFSLTTLALLLYLARGFMYAQMRVNGVRLTPTQFPEGYRMLVEAAAAAGMRKVPDAYVVSGGGTINAFASGHAWRRFIVVYSDLFEVGGEARDPDALRFVIGHEVGHLGAGHVSYWRQWLTAPVSQLPFLGNFLSRAQEYTADNFGHYYVGPKGAHGGIRLLAGGKYLNANVNFDEFADRSFTEKGLFVWATNIASTHPILLWRAQALRDRTQPGRLFLRPKGNPGGIPSLPGGSDPTDRYPNPNEALEFLEAFPPKGTVSQFGAVFPKPLPGEEITADHSEYGQRMLTRGWRHSGPGGPGGPAGPGGPGGFGEPGGPGAEPTGFNGPGGFGPGTGGAGGGAAAVPGGQPAQPMNWPGTAPSYDQGQQAPGQQAPGQQAPGQAQGQGSWGTAPQGQASAGPQSQSSAGTWGGTPQGQPSAIPQSQPSAGTWRNAPQSQPSAAPVSQPSANPFTQPPAAPAQQPPAQQPPAQQAPAQQAPAQQPPAQQPPAQQPPAGPQGSQQGSTAWGGPAGAPGTGSPFLAPQSAASASDPAPRRAQADEQPAPPQHHRPVAPPAQEGDTPAPPSEGPSEQGPGQSEQGQGEQGQGEQGEDPWGRGNDPWNRS